MTVAEWTPTPSFAPLQAAYTQRQAAAHAAKARGRRVVGYMGNTVPVELILAAGCVPVRIAPAFGDPTAADDAIERFSDSDMRLAFAQYCAGEFDALDLLVIPRSTETQHKLYLALREAWRTGIVTRGPALHLYDILHTQRESSRAYGLARTGELWQRLCSITGAAADDTALREAIGLTNHTRTLLQHLQQQRRAGSVCGSQALVAIGATRFLPPQEANAALQQWLAAHDAAPCSGPRLLVKGCPLDHECLHLLVEAAGACVLAEDDEWGSRAAAPLIATDRPPLEAIFERHWRDVPCVRQHPDTAARAWFTQALADPLLDGVLFYLPPPDDIHGWDFPAQRAQVEAVGLPWLLIREDARTPVHLSAQLQAFIATRPARRTTD
ncbi:MAG: 2-hydroxyacyl-CoA dehydratase [Burkholderiales bacterium]|nr:2-hydroxyacyl-CoA dehydratase [Burkholderiales bacterium]